METQTQAKILQTNLQYCTGNARHFKEHKLVKYSMSWQQKWWKTLEKEAIRTTK